MPATKVQPSRNPVDLTRKTPWRTEYRVCRVETAGIEGEGWVTLCLAHSQHVISPTLGKACTAGTKGAVAEFCDKCKTLSTAPKESPAKVEPAVVVAPTAEAKVDVVQPRKPRKAVAAAVKA
jgi:hypothetical protein